MDILNRYLLVTIIKYLRAILKAVERLPDIPEQRPPEPAPVQPEPTPPTDERPGTEYATGTIIRPIDGDTFEVERDDGTPVIVRLLGIDTPEVSRQFQDTGEFGLPATKQAQVCLLNWGRRASEYSTTLAGKDVTLRTDPRAGESDQYGRTLAYAFVDGTHINHDLLRNGLARVYSGETFEAEPAFMETELTAHTNNTGLWGCDE